MKLHRQHKIMVAYSVDRDRRDAILARMLTRAGFAITPGQAKSIIRPNISDIDLETCFFVAVSNFNFSRSHLITQTLIRMAMAGIPVFISTRHIPNHLLQFCDVHQE